MSSESQFAPCSWHGHRLKKYAGPCGKRSKWRVTSPEGETTYVCGWHVGSAERRGYESEPLRKPNPKTWAPIRPRIEANTKIDAETGCWNWTGATNNGERPGRYGVMNFNGKSSTAHRASYTEWKGDIPKGWEVDHLCGNTLCVNPEHLEAVDRKTHLLHRTPTSLASRNAAKTHCPSGHPYTAENTVVRNQSSGRSGLARFCKQCLKDQHAKAKTTQGQRAMPV